METLHLVDTVVLDKTGTITIGKPKVTDIISIVNEKELIRVAGSLEKSSEHFQDMEGIVLPVEKTDSASNIYWVFGIVLNKNIKVDNRAVQKLLFEQGIGSRTFFWCMHEQPVFQRQGLFFEEKYPEAEYLARKGFYIPSGLALTEKQMEKVVLGVKNVITYLSC